MFSFMLFPYRPLEIMVFEWMQKQLQPPSDKEEIAAVQKEEMAVSREIDRDKAQKSFSQLGGDSLSATHLSSLLKEHLSLEVAVSVILKTPLAGIVSDLLHGSSSTETPNWASEATLELDTAEPCSLLNDLPEVASSVFLTGCTGFLGRFILWELLKDTTITKVFCLAQSKKGIMQWFKRHCFMPCCRKKRRRESDGDPASVTAGTQR